MRRAWTVLACAAALSTSAPALSAQSLDVSSSMGAHCLGTCQTVQFFLDVDGSNVIDVLRIASWGGIWTFGTILTPGWFQGGTPTHLTAFASSAMSEPLTLTVDMTSWGTPSQLYNGSLTYTGQGFNQANQLVSIQGQVVPEPSTWILLGTGLLLMGVVVRRRRELEKG